MNARRTQSNTPKTPDPSADRSRESVLRQLAALQDLTTEQLKDKWRDLCGGEPPAYNRPFLIRRLAYRIQEIFYGGLSPVAREKLVRVAEGDPMARLAKPKARGGREICVPEGTRLVRLWQGRRYEVVVTQGGFELDGQRYRSLSAVAKQITGTHWNGKVFFGVKQQAAGAAPLGKERS